MKNRVVAIAGALCIAAGLVLASVLHGGSRMDRLTGSWYCVMEDASQYLVLRNDLTYTLTQNIYNGNESWSETQDGTFLIDGSTISIDMPEKGNVTVYKVSFSEDADAMTWTETPQHSWGYEFEYQRCE